MDGYYNSLLSFIDKAVDEGFITPSARHIIVSANTAHELMSKLEVITHLKNYCLEQVYWLAFDLVFTIMLILAQHAQFLEKTDIILIIIALFK